MANPLTKLVAAIVFVAGTSSLATLASATPLANGPAIKNAVPASVETVQWRRGWGYRGGWGRGPVLGVVFVAGALIGGALAADCRINGHDPYYYPGPYAVPPEPLIHGAPWAPPVPVAPVAEDAVAYCMQRFKSYDPRSRTYLGYDGRRTVPANASSAAAKGPLPSGPFFMTSQVSRAIASLRPREHHQSTPKYACRYWPGRRHRCSRGSVRF